MSIALTEANPVRADDLTPLDLPDRFGRRRLTTRRFVAVIAILVIVVGRARRCRTSIRTSPRHGRARVRGSGPVLVTLGYHRLGPLANGGNVRERRNLARPALAEGPINTGGPPQPIAPVDPTTAFYRDGPTGATDRLGHPWRSAGTTSLAEARAAFRAAFVLPDVAPVDPSGIDKVTKDCGEPPRGTGCDVGIGCSRAADHESTTSRLPSGGDRRIRSRCTRTL